MSVTTYDKIIRDKVPAKIHANGKGLVTDVVTDDVAIDYLIKKVNEELVEYQGGDDGPSLEPDELTDLYEVVVALASKHGISESALKQRAQAKRESRGGFAQNIILKEVRS